MPTFQDFQYWYKVTSGLPGGTLTLGSSVTRGGGAPHRVSDIKDGTSDGITVIEDNAADGRAGDPDQGSMSFQGFTSNGEPIFFFPSSQSFFNGFRIYSDTLYPSGTTIGSTANGVYMYCFAPDTMIATPDGETRVDALAIGDRVQTADGRDVPVKWIGKQTIYPGYMGAKSEPVRVKAGAFGSGVPHSDLVLTADHGLILDDLVINAGALVNGTSIQFVPASELPNPMIVYHVETENHDMILANGAVAETFLDVTDRKSFDNHGEYLDLYGIERIIPEMPYPRISSARLVPASIRQRLGISDHAISLTG